MIDILQNAAGEIVTAVVVIIVAWLKKQFDVTALKNGSKKVSDL